MFDKDPHRKLIYAFYSGDADSIDKLYRLTRSDLVQSLSRFRASLPDEETVDIVADFFSDLLEKARLGRCEYVAGRGTFLNWARTVVQRRAISLLRKSGRLDPLPEGNEPNVPMQFIVDARDDDDGSFQKWIVLGLTSEQRAEFLICLPIGPDTWKLAEVLGLPTERCYWRLIHPYALGEANVEEGVRKLLAYDRPYAAIELLSVQVRRAKNYPITLIAEALERLIKPTPEDDRPHNSVSRNVSRLLNILALSKEIDESRIAQIEWVFLPLLSAFDRKPEILHRELAKRPEFFSEVVSLVFPAEGREATEVSAEDRARGSHAYRLLQSWRIVPGAENGSTFDGETFKDWMRRARELLAKSERAAAGDEMLGHLLSGAPFGEGGAWPHPAVCEVIEESSSKELEHGIEIGLYNNRGVVMKDPTAGGVLERQLAERYDSYAETTRERWPRTSAMLRRVSDQYKREAKSEDQEVQLREELE